MPTTVHPTTDDSATDGQVTGGPDGHGPGLRSRPRGPRNQVARLRRGPGGPWLSTADLTVKGRYAIAFGDGRRRPPLTASLHGPVGRVLRLVFEVIDGRRPAEHLTEIVAPSVLRYARAARPRGRPTRVSRLLSVRVCHPTQDAVEAAAVVALGERVRAVAARLEHDPTGWRCVALRIL